MAVVRNKSQIYELLRADKFGNHFPWVSYEEWLHELHEDAEYSLRFGLQLNAPWEYHLSYHKALVAANYNTYGCAKSQISVVTMPIGIQPVINAEVQWSEIGVELHYSTVQDVMRRSLARGGRTVAGIVSVEIMRHYCDPCSYDDIRALLSEYDGSVIEFTVFDRDVGVFPHRNTIIWEVRNY